MLTVESTRATGGKCSHQGNDPDRGKSGPRLGSFTLFRTKEFSKNEKCAKNGTKFGIFYHFHRVAHPKKHEVTEEEKKFTVVICQKIQKF